MKLSKVLLSAAMFCVMVLPVVAKTEISDLDMPKEPSYRVGTSDTPEKQYIQAQEDIESVRQLNSKIDNEYDTSVSDMTYADLSIKRLSKEVAQELQYEESEMVSDLSLLWQGAAVQSDTINFALYKLANPDADKPDEKSIKNILKTIASMSTLVGAGIGSPVIAGASLMGGNILGIMSQDTKALNYKYTRVNDADMIILIRKVEDLQQKTVDLYYDYISAKKQLEFANELVVERQNKFNLAQKNNAPRELIVITDAYYRTALDRQRSAKAEFFSKRAALEQFVGNETFLQFESELNAREKGETHTAKENTENKSENKESTISEEQTQDYNATVQNVENYTSNIEPPEVNDNNVEISEQTPNSPKFSEHNNLDYLIDKKITEQEIMTGFAADIENVEAVFSDNTSILAPVGITSPKKAKKVKKEKIKKEKQVKEKPLKEKKIKEKKVKEKQLKEKSVNEKLLNETKTKEKPIKEKPVKEKKVKDKPIKEKKVKERKQKEQVSQPPELVRPTKKYPRNSTKDLIFLHGEDKRNFKSSIKETIDGIFPVIETKRVNENVPQTPQTATTVQTSVEPTTTSQVLQPVKQNQTTVNANGFLPLDEIKIPELKKGGYSIHSEYGVGE